MTAFSTAHLLPALLDRARRVSPSDPELRRLAARGGRTTGAVAGPAQPGLDVRHGAYRGLARKSGGWAARASGAPTWPRCAPQVRGHARELIAASWDRPPANGLCSCRSEQTDLSLADEPLSRPRLTTARPRSRLAAHLSPGCPGPRSAAGWRGVLRLPAPGPGAERTNLVATRQPMGRRHATGRDIARPGGGTRAAGRRGHLLVEVIARTPLTPGRVISAGRPSRSSPFVGRWRRRCSPAGHGRRWPTRPGVDGRADQLGHRRRADRHPFGAETLRQLARRPPGELRTGDHGGPGRRTAAGHRGRDRGAAFPPRPMPKESTMTTALAEPQGTVLRRTRRPSPRRTGRPGRADDRPRPPAGGCRPGPWPPICSAGVPDGTVITPKYVGKRRTSRSR